MRSENASFAQDRKRGFRQILGFPKQVHRAACRAKKLKLCRCCFEKIVLRAFQNLTNRQEAFSDSVWAVFVFNLHRKLQFFCDYLFLEPNESTGSGFESQHKPCFLLIYTEKCTKVLFFKRQKELCLISILSHMGGADSRHSWLLGHQGCLVPIDFTLFISFFCKRL